MNEDYRHEITSCFEQEDWHGAYQWAKGWIGSGGGARSVEPWLVYVASMVKQSQRRHAVRSADLALEHWIAKRSARGVLLYVRAEVIRRHLKDPKTALEDLRTAEETAPDWLHDDAEAARRACEEEALTSRKRKRSVPPAPSLRRGRWRPSGGDVKSPPPLWATVHAMIRGEDE